MVDTTFCSDLYRSSYSSGVVFNVVVWDLHCVNRPHVSEVLKNSMVVREVFCISNSPRIMRREGSYPVKHRTRDKPNFLRIGPAKEGWEPFSTQSSGLGSLNSGVFLNKLFCLFFFFFNQ